MKIISGLSDLAARYDVILCDVWGVIRDGRRLLPGAFLALEAFRKRGGRVALVSNAPRPSADLSRQLARLGARDGPWDAIVTSGDAIRHALAARAPGPAFHIGPPGYDDSLFEGLGLDFAGPDQAAFAVCTGLVDDARETPEDYRDLLERLRARDLDFVCANPDIVVQHGDGLIWCAGALARDYEALGGRAVVAGKPHRPVYDLAFERLGIAAPDMRRVLAIGDGPETDIKGAQVLGADALFIAAGILGDRFNGGLDAETVKAALAGYGVSARWGAQSLVW